MGLSTIQLAAKRLEELQRAGVDMPWHGMESAQRRGTGVEAPVAGSPIRAEAQWADPGQTVSGPGEPPAVAADAGRRFLDATAAVRGSRTVGLNLTKLQSEGYLVPGQPRNALADQFRVIKRPLLKNARKESESGIRRGNLIQVTSAQPGEGKSFVAINLAMSIASEVDHSVLLVDADVLRPSILERLGTTSELGLLDLLRAPETELADVLIRTNIPKLTLLPAGRASANSTELLASAAIERLMDDLASRFEDRIIIFDSPPLLSTPESRVLTTRVGQIVMVVESLRTRKKDVLEAFATVSTCPVVLSVLNKCPDIGAVGAYGY
jgi:protein-tyrosine kinase